MLDKGSEELMASRRWTSKEIVGLSGTGTVAEMYPAWEGARREGGVHLGGSLVMTEHFPAMGWGQWGCTVWYGALGAAVSNLWSEECPRVSLGCD